MYPIGVRTTRRRIISIVDTVISKSTDFKFSQTSNKALGSIRRLPIPTTVRMVIHKIIVGTCLVSIGFEVIENCFKHFDEKTLSYNEPLYTFQY